MSRKERIIIAIIAVVGFALFWMLDSRGHPLYALIAYAVPAFLYFIWVPYRGKKSAVIPANNNEGNVQ